MSKLLTQRIIRTHAWNFNLEHHERRFETNIWTLHF